MYLLSVFIIPSIFWLLLTASEGPRLKISTTACVTDWID
jgi:hypothetical protein